MRIVIILKKIKNSTICTKTSKFSRNLEEVHIYFIPMKKPTVPLRFGIAISGSLIAYFLILSLFDLHTSPLWSMFNVVIVGFGIYEAIRSYKLSHGPEFNYTNGFITGILTGFVSTFVFTIFFILYAIEYEPPFLFELVQSFKEHNIFLTGLDTNDLKFETTTTVMPEFESSIEILVRLLMFSSVAILGFLTTIILTLVFMQKIPEQVDKSEWYEGGQKNKNTDL